MTAPGPFTSQDLLQIAEHGLDPSELAVQLERFARGPVYARLLRPCRVGDGVRRLSENERRRLSLTYDLAARSGKAMKFVPASGAGTRMFQKFLEGRQGAIGRALETELLRLAEYPFYPELHEKMQKAGISLDEALSRRDFPPVLEFLLGDRGLNYADSPKGLVLFHRYPEGARSAFEEQLAEAAELVRDDSGRARIHFTVSERHREKIRAHWARASSRLSEEGTVLEIGDSLQATSTDTIAADEKGRPFRDQRGRLVFRPAGHGALLENLQNLDGDLVFLKNIDNVATASRRGRRLDWERALGGTLLELQREAFERLRRLEAGADSQFLEESGEWAQRVFGLAPPKGWSLLAMAEKVAWLASALDRPLRAVGVVPNQGETGGAPFWILDGQGRISAQLVESAQVDPASEEQKKIFREATHFNPVILACGLRDYRGRAFDLKRFSDPESGFISQKSHEGKALQALELPGLWNGSMAYWNTVFVEIPAETFTPVKTAEDLLRPEHQTVSS